MTAVLSIPGAPLHTRRARSRVEDSIQIGVIAYLRMVLDHKGFRSFAIPNGSGKLSPRAGKRLKDMGVLAGVPDIGILGPTGRFYCNRIPDAIVRNIEDAKRALIDWGLLAAVAA